MKRGRENSESESEESKSKKERSQKTKIVTNNFCVHVNMERSKM